jgi:hypothetical protein
MVYDACPVNIVNLPLTILFKYLKKKLNTKTALPLREERWVYFVYPVYLSQLLDIITIYPCLQQVNKCQQANSCKQVNYLLLLALFCLHAYLFTYAFLCFPRFTLCLPLIYSANHANKKPATIISLLALPSFANQQLLRHYLTCTVQYISRS